MYYRNPANNRIEHSTPFIPCLLFGPLYWAVKGIWIHAVAELVLVCMTGGVAWLLYPFVAPGIIAGRYARQGWIRVDREGRPEVKTVSGIQIGIGTMF